MSDLDFEELENAVNSLKSQSQKTDESTEAQGPANPVSTENSSATSPVAPVTPPAATVPQTPAPAIRRTTGRFMDVVPPSSASRGMSSKFSQQPVSRPVVRDSGLLQPIAAPEANSVAPSETAAPVNEPELSVVAEEELTSAIDASPAPMQSPFLTDVEVDKRPLGSTNDSFAESGETAPSPAVEIISADVSPSLEQPTDDGSAAEVASTPDASLSPESSDSWATEIDERVAPEVDVETEVIPPEMSPEIIALESSDDNTAASQESVAPQTPESAPSSQTQPAGNPATPGDIVPQYTPSATESPQPSAIFDTASEVPQQLSHPEHKKSGWMVLVWILLLVIVGVGGGVAAWYFLA